jgi:hypothetical protein
VAEPVEVLERRIDALRAAVRRSVVAGDTARARALRAELRAAERAWDEAIANLAEATAPKPEPVATRAVPARPVTPLLPVREQVHDALTLLTVPAAPKLIADVHEAFFGTGGLAAGRLTHLRRDERRSYETARRARPYYLCSALTAEYLTPARGLFAVSTWPLERRIVGPLSPRVHFLTAAVRIAERAARLPRVSAAVTRLLWRFATNIPGAAAPGQLPATVDTRVIIEAAGDELEVHIEADRAQRAAAADRARRQLDDVAQLFGHTLDRVRGTKTA